MSAAARKRLPERRPSVSETIERNGLSADVSCGFDPATGELREIFIFAGKEGSETRHALEDAAVMASVALQHGIPLEALRRSLARVATGPVDPENLDRRAETAPASMIGLALDAAQRIAADFGS
ncbi:MAG: hypothetical protein TEF_00365 [Rhizobiales bacterium NRL2]|jgi:ribonucleoside-diphosphate reductase alpha chain|nr:MAG: hypothetical protein TEF_00365 [Rhizobiales bacterium NRL2]